MNPYEEETCLPGFRGFVFFFVFLTDSTIGNAPCFITIWGIGVIFSNQVEQI